MMEPTSESGRPHAEGSGRVVAGRYRLIDEIGRGGMGVVWRAWDELIQRNVAVKEVRRPAGLPQAEAEVLNERTMREARAAGRLSNPHVVTVFDVVVENGRPWIVMELLHARSLAEVMKSEGRLSPQRVARIGLQVLSALDDAHAAGMVHRDVKPGNVMLGSSDWVTLTDFGLATSSGDAHLTGTGLLVGSPSYLAPERARGEAELGPQSDLWSLGATMYAAVEGRSPFDRGDPMATLAAVLTEEPAPMRHSGPLEGTLIGLLRKDPAGRYDTATTRALLEHTAALPEETPQMRRSRREGRSGSEATTDEMVTTLGGGAATAGAALTAGAAATWAAGVPEPTIVQDVRPAPGPAPEPAPSSAVAPPAAAVPAQPAPAPSGAPSSARPRRGTLVRTLAAGLLVAVLAALAAYWFSQRGDGASGSSSDLGSASASPSASPSASGGREAVPAGYAWYVDPAYQVAVPGTWVRSGGGTRADFTDPEGGAYLRIEYGPANPAGALGAWQQAEAAWSASAPDYVRIRLEPVDYRGYDAAEWEWTDSNDGRARHVVNRTFVIGDTGYAIMLDAVPEKWDASQAVFDTAVDTFTPLP